MDYFIKINDNKEIESVYKTNSINDGIKISKTQFNKISNELGKINKYISKKVVVEDDPNYQNDIREKQIADIQAEKIESQNKATFEHAGRTFSANQESKNNWTSTLVAIQSGLITFPCDIVRDVNKQFYTIDTQEEFMEMAGKLLEKYNEPRIIETQKINELD